LNLERKKVFNLILGQCTTALKDKMKSDKEWETTTKSYNPIQLYKIVERSILKQSESEYVFATGYEHEIAVKTFKQGSLSNAAFMEKMNTRFDVAKSVGVDFGWHNLWEHCAKQTHKQSYDQLTIDEMEEVREDAEERYLAYHMIHNSSSLHETLQMDLMKQFTQGDNNME